MNRLTKKFFAGLLASSILFIGSENVFAEEKNPPPFRQEMNLDYLAKKFSEQYGLNEKEVRAALEDKKHPHDIYFAALLSNASGKSFKQVLSMKSDWFDVMKDLNVSKEKFEAMRKEFLVKDIVAESYLDSTTVENLLKDNYKPRDIRISGILAKSSNKNVRAVLDMKKLNKTWSDVAEELGVDKNLIRSRHRRNFDGGNFMFNPQHRHMGNRNFDD